MIYDRILYKPNASQAGVSNAEAARPHFIQFNLHCEVMKIWSLRQIEMFSYDMAKGDKIISIKMKLLRKLMRISIRVCKFPNMQHFLLDCLKSTRNNLIQGYD